MSTCRNLFHCSHYSRNFHTYMSFYPGAYLIVQKIAGILVSRVSIRTPCLQIRGTIAFCHSFKKQTINIIVDINYVFVPRKLLSEHFPGFRTQIFSLFVALIPNKSMGGEKQGPLTQSPLDIQCGDLEKQEVHGGKRLPIDR